MNTRPIAALLVVAALSACVSTPGTRPAAASAPPPPAPAPLTKVYFYPTQGQSEEQQDRDRYECFNWSVKQTGYDPSQHLPPGETTASVVPERSPAQTVGAAAAIGAVIGAITASPEHAGKGAVIGAMAGTVVGSAAAASEQQAQAAPPPRYRGRGYGRYEQQATEFRRAMSACLEGRGYTVK